MRATKRRRAGASPLRAALLTSAVALAALLAVARLLRPAEPADAAQARKYFYDDVLEPFFAPDPGAPGLLRARRPGALAEPFSAAKPAGLFRAFVVGGSIAARFDGADSLRAGLALALPSLKVEALNCGMMGYESSRERALVHELLGYSPDAIVLLSAQNEGLGSPPLPRWRWKTLEALHELGLDFGAMSRLATGRAAAAASTAAVDEAFARDLAAMADEAAARGSRLVVVLPPLNYRDGPPTGRFDALDPAFAPGWLRYLRGDPRGALAAWAAERASTDAHRRAEALFYSGRCAERLGRWAEARRYYAEAFDDGSLRAGPRRLALMRRVAAEHGATVVDVDAAFRARAFPRSPGFDMFIDRVHWLESDNDLAALAVVSAMKADPSFRLPWSPDGLRRARRLVAARRPFPTEGEVSSLDDETLSTLRQGLAAMNDAFDTPSPEAVVSLDAVLGRRPAWFSDLDSLARRAEAGPGAGGKPWGTPALNVDRARLAWHAAEVFLERGRAARAAELFSRAFSGEPGLGGALNGLVLADAVLGERARVEELLARLDGELHRGQDARALRTALAGPEK